MRMNFPVSNIEIFLQYGKSIVSKTDLKGNITYVNPYFVEISGFSEEELMGAPQNIVRRHVAYRQERHSLDRSGQKPVQER